MRACTTHTHIKVCISDRIDCPCMWCIAYRDVNLIKMQLNSNSTFQHQNQNHFSFGSLINTTYNQTDFQKPKVYSKYQWGLLKKLSCQGLKYRKLLKSINRNVFENVCNQLAKKRLNSLTTQWGRY